MYKCNYNFCKFLYTVARWKGSPRCHPLLLRKVEWRMFTLTSRRPRTATGEVDKVECWAAATAHKSLPSASWLSPPPRCLHVHEMCDHKLKRFFRFKYHQHPLFGGWLHETHDDAEKFSMQLRISIFLVHNIKY